MKLHELDEPKWDYVMWCIKKQNVGRYLELFLGESRVDFSMMSLVSVSVMFDLQQVTCSLPCDF